MDALAIITPPLERFEKEAHQFLFEQEFVWCPFLQLEEICFPYIIEFRKSMATPYEEKLTEEEEGVLHEFLWKFARLKHAIVDQWEAKLQRRDLPS